MTRDEVIAKMREELALLPEEVRNLPITSDGDRVLSPADILAEIESDSDLGKGLLEARQKLEST